MTTLLIHRARCIALMDDANTELNDASLLPTAPGVNPQASVMAFAIRNARRFVATGGTRV